MLVLAVNRNKRKIRDIVLALSFALAAGWTRESQGAVDRISNPLKAAALAFQVKTEDRAGWHFGQFSDSTWNLRLHDRLQILMPHLISQLGAAKHLPGCQKDISILGKKKRKKHALKIYQKDHCSTFEARKSALDLEPIAKGGLAPFVRARHAPRIWPSGKRAGPCALSQPA